MSSSHNYRILPVLLYLVFSAAGLAAAEEQEVPEPPDLPLPEMIILEREGIEPEVTIIKKEEGTIYEYRINGQLYMVKIQPVAGPPYYMVDRDGDGEFDSRSTDPTDISVPQWILMRW